MKRVISLNKMRLHFVYIFLIKVHFILSNNLYTK